LAAISTLAALAAACGGAASPTPLSQSQAGQTYLDDIAPVHSASAAFLTAATLWNLSTTDAEAFADARPLINAETTFDSQLSSTPWPSSTTADIQTLITENKVIIADLDELQTITLATIAAWDVKIKADTAVDVTDSGLIRSDLGLPPATS
jgi:hypothetical protein